MKRLLGLLLILNVFLLILGCGPTGRPSQRKTDFSDSGFPSGKAAAEEPAPLLKGQREYVEIVPAGEAPPVDPLPGPMPPKLKEPFDIASPKLVINVDNAEVDFEVEIITEKSREKIHLKGPFDKSGSPWIAHLYSVDKKVLEERRVSASVTCLTAYDCDSIGVKIVYTIDGVPKEIYRESGVDGPRLATSGDSEDVLDQGKTQDDLETPVAEEEPANESAGKEAFEIDESTGQPRPKKSEPDSPANPPTKKKRVPVLPPMPAPAESEAPAKAAPPVKKPQPSVKLEDIPPESRKDLLVGVMTPIYVPSPPPSEFRVRGLPEEPPAPVDVYQAYGHHRGGVLKKSTFIPPETNSFIRAARLLNQNTSPEKDSSGAFTTKYGLDYLNEVAEALAKKYPEDRMIIGTVSGQSGGHRSGHSSHQIGLDFDIFFFSKSRKPVSYAAVLSEGGAFVKEWDVAKNYDLLKTLVALHPDQVVIAFLHNRLTQALCVHAKTIGEPINEPGSAAYELFRRLAPETRVDSVTKRVFLPFTHYGHVHVRLKCNPNDRFCRYENIGLPAQGKCR